VLLAERRHRRALTGVPYDGDAGQFARTPLASAVPGLTGTFEGNTVDISQTYGQKSGLTTFTCTQNFEDPEDQTSIHITLLVGLVPPE
jgi:hypothetical protein